MMKRAEKAGAVAILLLVPVLLLWDRRPEAATVAGRARPRMLAVVAGAPQRRLFGGGLDDPAIQEAVAGASADLPAVVGIVGRLPDAAVAMVRDDSGRSRSVAVGDVSGGWRLEGLAADSAVFSRGGERVRVRLAE